MKVRELYAECESLVKRGFGEKEIYISNDDEGNGYHTLFYSFLTDEKDIKACMDYFSPWDKDAKPENIVILG